MTAQPLRRPARLDLLPPTPDPDPAVPTTGERLIVLGGLWALPILNTLLLVVVLIVLLR